MNYIKIQLVLVLVLDTDLPDRLLRQGCPAASRIFYSDSLSMSSGIYTRSCFFSLSISIYFSHSFSSSLDDLTSQHTHLMNLMLTASAARTNARKSIPQIAR